MEPFSHGTFSTAIYFTFILTFLLFFLIFWSVFYFWGVIFKYFFLVKYLYKLTPRLDGNKIYGAIKKERILTFKNSEKDSDSSDSDDATDDENPFNDSGDFDICSQIKVQYFYIF